jgi:uncharacterized protein YndB with AHSA1/START domain
MRFRLHTEFTLAAPRAAVFRLICNAPAWPQWWRGCARVDEIGAGGVNGVGARYRVVWRTRLRRMLTLDSEVIEVEDGTLLRTRCRGDLEAGGTWRLADAPPGTRVQHLWVVDARAAWVPWLAFAAVPLLRLEHDRLMRAGAVGMAARLRLQCPP